MDKSDQRAKGQCREEAGAQSAPGPLDLIVRLDARADMEALPEENLNWQQGVKSERLRILGSLVGSIVHEFNNPLCGIHSVVERLLRGTGLDKSDRTLLELALDQCQRMKGLVRDLQHLHQSAPESFKVFDLCEAIASVLRLLNKHLKVRRVRVETVFPAEPVWLFGVEAQIRQMLLKLLQESSEAEGRAGSLLRLGLELSDARVRIRLWANKPGLRPNQPAGTGDASCDGNAAAGRSEREPSVVQAIIRIHGGELIMAPQPAEETLWTIFLPVAQPDSGSKE